MLILIGVMLILIYRLCLSQVGDGSFPELRKFTKLELWATALLFCGFSLSSLVSPFLLKELPPPQSPYVNWGLLATALVAPLTGPIVLLHALYRFTWEKAIRFTAIIQFLAVVYLMALMPMVCAFGGLLSQWL